MVEKVNGIGNFRNGILGSMKYQQGAFDARLNFWQFVKGATDFDARAGVEFALRNQIVLPIPFNFFGIACQIFGTDSIDQL